ncbi:MAG: hypothetical protein QM796_08975 [Chthoniobacteraceae bacterium]
MKPIRTILMLVLAMAAIAAKAQSPYSSGDDFAKYAMKLRESALLKIEPRVFVPTLGRTFVGGRYPWKTNIVTTVFWVGEQPTQNNPVPNTASSWDRYWVNSFGGFDNPDPSARRNFIPANFIPQQNPFYCALPYNDVTSGATKPEARLVIPWFKDTFIKEGQSVCRDRWIAIRYRSKVCYAQWSDCGPWRTDYWQYVFGNQSPDPRLNNGAGLDVSPAVRDYLGLPNKDVTDWKFVEFRDIPPGPWARYGNNNTFVINGRRSSERVVERQSNDGPTVLTK